MRDLRNIYTDLPDLEKDGKEYNTKYAKERSDEVEYKKTKAKKNSNYWKKFKPSFNEYTKSKCPICEGRVNKYDDIEHYRPKEHYWWLAYDFYNYYNCCALCNRDYKLISFPLFDESKKVDFATKANITDEEPLLFNPLKDNPLELFQLEFLKISPRGYYPDLRIIPNDKLDQNSYEYAKAVKTIKVLNLNNENPKKGKSDSARLATLYEFAHTLWDFKIKIGEWKEEADPEKKAVKLQRIKESRDKSGLFLCEFVIRNLYTVLPSI